MKGGRGVEAPLKKKTDRSLLPAALTAQLSLRRWVLVGQSGRPRVALAASDGTVGVIGGDITLGRNAWE